MKLEFLHPADQLVMFMDRIYHYGMTTTSGGNLSIKDENGDIWITPSGIDKGSLTRADMCQVKPDGTIIGPHKPSVELPFHSKIYQIRPDLKAILHAHPPTLVAFSLARKIPNTSLIATAKDVCGEVSMAKYDVPGSTQLGDNIAEEFEKGYNTVMMENHGVVCGATDLFKAFMAFETLDFCGRIEIDAEKLGTPRPLTDEQIAMNKFYTAPILDEYVPSVITSEERAARRDLCRLVHRSYDQKLFNSSQGTYSVKLSDGSFLITPYQKDRKYIEPEDIVHIKGGMREIGKIPSRATTLHQKIYDNHPAVKSIINAHPPGIISFSITDTEFDSRTIPESYIQLRDVKRLPYMSSYRDEEGTVATFGPKTPAIILDNQCVIVTGNSLLNAFDRLEVLEYSATAIIACRDIGDIVLISPEEVDVIEEAFNLK